MIARYFNPISASSSSIHYGLENAYSKQKKEESPPEKCSGQQLLDISPINLEVY
jgi:hypothetical protein